MYGESGETPQAVRDVAFSSHAGGGSIVKLGCDRAVEMAEGEEDEIGGKTATLVLVGLGRNLGIGTLKQHEY